jgi:hypothetical protein
MAGVEIRNQIIGMQLENSSSDLSPTSTGLVYFNTTSSIAKIYNGSSWKTFLFADLTNITGTLPIASGGTGQTSQTAAFDALAPTTTTGDMIYYNGTDNVRLPIGTNGQTLAVVAGAPAWADAGSGGSGEINLLTNPSAASATTGWSAGTNHTVTRLTSGSPLDPTIATAFRFAKTVASATTESSTSGDYSTFTLPVGLENTKHQVKFYCIVPATGVWRVSVYDGTTRLSLSTDSSSVTTLPAGFTGQFITTFSATTNNSYTVSFTETSGVICNLDATSIVVTPGNVKQGAVVESNLTLTGWSWSNLPTSSSSATYTRIGQWMLLNARGTASGAATGNIVFNMPSGLTIDTSQWPGSSEIKPVGVVKALNTGTDRQTGVVCVDSSTTIVFISDGGGGYWNNSDPMGGAWANNDTIEFQAMIPISQWATSGTVNLAENNVEYSWSAETGTTANTLYSDTSKYRYGPAGAQFNSIAASVGAGERTRYKVGFQTPVQPSDVVTIEVTTDGGTTWQELGSTDGLNELFFLDTGYYGMAIDAVDSTSANVVFGNRGRHTYGVTSFGGAGGAWSGLNTASNKWRVKKSSGGQAVGFGEVVPGTSSGLVSASGLKGRIDGGTVASGYVGEKLESAGSTTSTSTTNLCSVALTAGTWSIQCNVTGNMSSSAAGDYVDFALSTANNNLTGAITVSSQTLGISKGQFVTGAASRGMGATSAYVSLSGNQTYYLNSSFAGTGTIVGHILAVRVA